MSRKLMSPGRFSETLATFAGMTAAIMEEKKEGGLAKGVEMATKFKELIAKHVKDFNAPDREELRLTTIEYLEYLTTYLKSRDLVKESEAERRIPYPKDMAFVVGQPYSTPHVASGLSFDEKPCYHCKRKIAILPSTVEEAYKSPHMADGKVKLEFICGDCLEKYDLRQANIEDFSIDVPQ